MSSPRPTARLALQGQATVTAIGPARMGSRLRKSLTGLRVGTLSGWRVRAVDVGGSVVLSSPSFVFARRPVVRALHRRPRLWTGHAPSLSARARALAILGDGRPDWVVLGRVV